ncbi:MAG TPA: hypothetical protein EYH59_03410 [Pyrodictium sp.]|nr:hypothetical protein [Pyrodictium sp.]
MKPVFCVPILALLFLSLLSTASALTIQPPSFRLIVELPPGTPHQTNSSVSLPLPTRVIFWIIVESLDGRRLHYNVSVTVDGNADVVELGGSGRRGGLAGYGDRVIIYGIIDARSSFKLVVSATCSVDGVSTTKMLVVRVSATKGPIARFSTVYLPVTCYGEVDVRRKPYTLTEQYPSIILQLLGVYPENPLLGYMKVCVEAWRKEPLLIVGGVYDEHGNVAPIASSVLEPGTGAAYLRTTIDFSVCKKLPCNACVIIPLWGLERLIPPGTYRIRIGLYIPGTEKPLDTYEHDIYIVLLGHGDIVVALSVACIGIIVLPMSYRGARKSRDLALAGAAGASLMMLSRLVGGIVFRISNILGPFDWIVHGPLTTGLYYAILTSLVLITRSSRLVGLAILTEWLLSALFIGVGNLLLSLLWCLTTIAVVALAAQLSLWTSPRLLPALFALAKMVDAYVDINIYAYTYRLYYAQWYILFYMFGLAFYALAGSYIAYRRLGRRCSRHT